MVAQTTRYKNGFRENVQKEACDFCSPNMSNYYTHVVIFSENYILPFPLGSLSFVGVDTAYKLITLLIITIMQSHEMSLSRNGTTIKLKC
jgi:hypothetical protein